MTAQVINERYSEYVHIGDQVFTYCSGCMQAVYKTFTGHSLVCKDCEERKNKCTAET